MDQKQLVDLLITNGDLFTGDRDRPHFRPGAIAVNDGIIVAVGQEDEVLQAFEADRSIDAKAGIVHPGFIDTHLHLTTMLFHGLPLDIDGLSESKVSYAQIKVETDDEITSAFTAASAAALLRRGFTLFMEAGTVFETDAFADTVTRSGMRGLVSAPYGWDDLSTRAASAPGTMNDKLLTRAPANAARVINGCERELKRNEDKNALVRGYVCLYGDGSSSDGLIRDAVALARERNVIYAQHQAFIPERTSIQEEKYGESGISRLNRLGALGPGTTLAHMNVLSERDAAIVMSARPGIVWCPNNALHRGIHPANKCYHPSFYKAGLNVSLGIDATLVHPLGSAGVAALLLSASVGERLEDSDPFYMQTIDAAENIGLDHELGSLSAGKRADIVIRAVEDVTHTSLDDFGSVLSTSSSMIPVNVVIVDGRVVMQDGSLMTMDDDEVIASASYHRNRLLQKVTR